MLKDEFTLLQYFVLLGTIPLISHSPPGTVGLHIIIESVFDQPSPDNLAHADVSLPRVSQCMYVIASGPDVRWECAK